MDSRIFWFCNSNNLTDSCNWRTDLNIIFQLGKIVSVLKQNVIIFETLLSEYTWNQANILIRIPFPPGKTAEKTSDLITFVF